MIMARTPCSELEAWGDETMIKRLGGESFVVVINGHSVQMCSR